ncbi:MAG TPA: acyl carrier protein [Anaerolineales bacterium]|nr:acyl carrier protein [Anaerolineales bacterium]
MTDNNGHLPHAFADEEVALEVRQAVARALDLDVEEVQLNSSLFGLGAESLDLLDMAFMLEKKFKIQFPRTDILERATNHFGEETLVQNGVVTDFGLKLLKKGMPELDPEVIKPGLKAIEVAKMITVGSFARITMRLLQAKEEFPLVCPKCGGQLVEAELMPEFTCTNCGEIVPQPTGDEILLQDLLQLAADIPENP